MRVILLFIALSVISLQSIFSQKVWNGLAGTSNWGDAANWSPLGVPANSDNVSIGSTFTVVINTNTAICKDLVCDGIIQFQNAANRSLTVTGNLSGTGTLSMLNASASGILYLQGNSQNISSFISGNAGTVNYSGTLTQDVAAWNYYNLTFSGARGIENVVLPNTGTVGIANTLSIGATFTTGQVVTTGSTVNYNGNANQNILGNTAQFNYNHLTISIPSGAASRTKSLAGSVTVGGNLLVESNDPITVCSLDPAAYNLTVTGNSTINTRGSLIDGGNGGTNIFTGKITINPLGNISSGATSPYTFTGGITNNGTFNITGAGVKTFVTNSQTIDGSQPITLAGNVNITGDIIITNLNSVTLNGALNGTTSGSMWVNGNGSALYYSNAAMPFATFGNWDMATSPNTVVYNGGNQNIRGGDYYNLTFSNNNTKTLQGPSPLNVNQTFTVSGTTNIACGTIDLNLKGLVNYSGTGTISTGINSVTYGFAGDQPIIPGTYGGSLLLSGSGNRNISGNTIITNALTIPNGISLNVNNFILSLANNLAISQGSQFNIISNASGSATLRIGNGRTLTNNGTFRITGTIANPAIVTQYLAGNYFVVQSDPTSIIHANNYQFNYLNGGINITAGAIDPVNNFSNGKFSNGIGSQSLLIQNVDLTAFPEVINTTFNTGPTYNVTRNAGNGFIQFSNSAGVLAGENFDNDDSNPGTRILWTSPATTYYSNPSGTFKAGLLTDWTQNPDGSGANPANLSDGLSSLIIQDGHTVTVDAANGNINVKDIQVGQGTSGVFLIGDNTTQRIVTIQQKLEIKSGASVLAGSIGAPFHTLQIYGNIYNHGSLALYNATGKNVNLEIYGVSSSIQGTLTPTLNEITFKTGSNAATSLSLDIRGNVFIENGAIFNDGNQNIVVKGNWNEAGSGQRTGNGNVTFSGSINAINNAGGSTGSTFYNVFFSGGGAGSVQDNITVNGDFYAINNTTVQINNTSATFLGNFTVDFGSTYLHSANTSNFNGTNTQMLNATGSVTFNNLSFANGLTNPKTALGTINASRQVAILAGATVDGNADWNIANGIRLDGVCNWSGIVNAAGGTIQTYNVSNQGTLGTALLNIKGGVYLGYTAPATSFQLTVNNDVDIQTGYLVLPNNTFLAGQNTRTLNLAAGQSLYIRGANNFPTGFGYYSLAPTSLVRYDWNLDQVVRGGNALNYGILVIDDNNSTTSWTKTADGTVTLASYLDLNGATMFNLDGNILNVAGNIYNLTNSSINGSTSSVFINAPDANQTIEGTGTGSYVFQNLNFTLDAGTATRTKSIQTGTNLSILGNLTISNVNGAPSVQHIVDFANIDINGTPANFNLGAYCQLNTSNAAFGANAMDKFAGTKILDPTSTFYYSLNGPQSIADGFTYGNLLFNGGNKIAEGALDINGNITGTGGGSPTLFFDAGLTHTVAGNWNLTTTNYTAATATGTIVLDGFDQYIGNSNFLNLTLNNTGTASLLSTVNILGNLTFHNNAHLDANSQTLNISGNWITPGNGMFLQSTGTVNFIGATNQTLQTNSISNIANLTINKPNTLGNQTVSLLSDLVVSNNTTLNTDAGVFDITGKTVRMGGRLYVYGNTVEPGLTFIAANSNIIFDGASSQYIYNNNSNPLTLNNVEFTGAGSKFFGWGGIAPATKMVDIDGNVLINGSSVNGSGWTHDVDINVAGDWTNNGTFSHGAGRVVTFDGTNQQISASSFGSVHFTNSNTKTLTGNITPSGNLTISGSATLDPNGNNINLRGNWDNSDPNAQFNSANGTVIFEGGSSTITTGTITGPLAGKGFNNIIVNKLAGNVASLAGDLEVKNDLTITSGYLRSNVFDLWIAGNYQNLGGIFDHNNNLSVITLNAAGGSKIFEPGTNAMVYPLRGIRINAPGTTYTVANNFTINQNQDFVLDNGVFNLNAHTIQLNTNNQKIVINGGTFDINAGSALTFNGNTQSLVNNGGTLKIVGSSTSIASLNRLGGNYTISQTAGIIHAGNYKIDYPSGITLSGGNIDATNNFSDGTFSSGSGLAYLTLTGLNFSDFTVSNVVFNNGPTYNVARTSGTGTLTFDGAIGTLSGENFDNDNGNPGTLINWSNIGGFYWDGGAGTDNWNDALNWSGNAVPDATSNVYLDHKYIASATPYIVKIKTANATSSRVILDTQGGAAITLQLEDGFDIDVNGSMIINSNTTVNIANAASTMNISGNWANAGTFNHGNSTVTFDGASTFFTIATGGSGVGKKFYNLNINAPAATYALTAAMDADNSVTVNAGTFDLASPNNDIFVGGNWDVNLVGGALFLPNQADVTFDGANQTINNGPFYNFLTANSGTKTITSNMAIHGSITLGNGTTLDAQDKNIFVAYHWINNGGSFAQSSLGTVTFNGTGTQQVDNGTGTTTFNNITFSNGGGKTLYKSNTINGNFTIDPGAGVVDAGVNQISGNGLGSFYGGNNTLFRLRGANNFPNNFSVINLSNSSTVEYIADIDQIVRVSPFWSYGNIRLTDATNASANSVKTAQAGELILTGSLTINDIRTLLDMAANSTNMTLTGTISFPTGGIQINWGTGTSTLTQIGVGDWTIDRDITGFNNLILSGWGNKWMQGDLAITGNVTVKNGVTLRMQESWGPPPVPHTMTGSPSKLFTMENGAGLVSPVGSISTPAFAVNFGSYSLGTNSTTTLNGYIDQTLYTGNGIIYGNLDLGGYNRDVTMDGIANLDINGWFNSNNAILTDNGKNISVAGSYTYLNYFTPTAGTTFTLDGGIPQTLYDGATSASNPTLDFSKIVFAGNNTKTFGDGNDIINITGDLSIANNVSVTSNRNINFSGLNWLNNGIFQHTGNTVTFDQTANQTINPGLPNASNYFYNVAFSNSNTKTFIANGVNVNGAFTINAGTVDLGNFTHYIAGNITNTTGGVLASALANLVFDGGNQNINTQNFIIDNVTIAGSGTKRMFSNWRIEGDLTINNLTALNTSDLVIPTFYDINIRGNWINNGTYTSNTAKVTFDGTTSPISITSNGSAFYNVDFTPGAAVQYNLLSPASRFSRAMNLSSNSTLNLNSNTLFLGSNIASGKVYNVQGTLNVNQNSFLKFNNQTSQSVMNVTGNLRILGSSSSNIATISRETAGVTGAETQINIQSGATIAAQYYLIEYLQDAGMNLMPGSILDASNNFSNGKWSNIRTAANVCYLNFEANYSGGDISNICFDFSGTPTQGQHFNVRRNSASPVITFAQVSGNLGSYLYEDDEIVIPSAGTGWLRWPALTSTMWIGGLSTDWHNPGNWSGGVPTPLLDAIIPKGTPNNPHILNSNADCKNLLISNGSVSLDFGFKLTSTGDINIGGTGTNNGILAVSSPASEIICGGFWTRGASGMFVHGNGTVRFVSSAGAATITPLASPFYNMVIDNPLTTFYLVGGTPSALTIKGSVDIKNGNLTPTNNNYNYNIEGDFIVETGVFTPVMGSVTAGTVNITGTGNQNITNATFYNLNVAGTGTKATHGPVTINNITTVSSTLKAEAGSNIDFNGNTTINAGGTFDDGDETHTFTGVTWTGTGNYSGNGILIFDRTTSDQNINSSKFSSLDINCTNRNLILNGNTSVTGDVIVRNGVANLYLNSNLLSSSNAVGTFTVEPTTVGTTGVIITGPDHFPSGFNSYNLANSSTVYYRGTSNQLVAGVSYGTLTLQNTNTKTLKGDISIQNTLTFNTSSLDVSPNNYSIALSGNWNNNSTGVFIPRNAEVVFEGNAANQTINVNATATNPFWDIRENKTAGQLYPNSSMSLEIKNNLVVENGRFNANGRNIIVENDLLALAGNFAQSGTYTMTKPSGTANIQSNGSIFNLLTIDAGVNTTIIALDNLRVDNNFTVQSGIFDGNGKRHIIGYNGNTIGISGTYRLGAGGTLEIGYNCNLSVNSGGTLEVIGIPGNAASITRNVNNWTGNYRFTVDGTIKAKYALFEYMGGQSNGIYITSNGTIDPANNFSYSTFNNGSTTGAMLTIENNQSFTGANAIFDVTFPTSPGGSAKNVRKNVSTTGVVEFYNANGVFAGENYDDDPFNIINWTGPITLTWNGSLNTDWNNATNWTSSSGPGFVPTGAENVIIAPALNQPILVTPGAVTAHLTIKPSAVLTLNTPLDGSANDLNVLGDLIIQGTLKETSANDFLSIEGNWIRSGITQLNGNITFNGTGASKVINNGNYPFYNVIIGGNALYKIATGSIITNDLTINPGASFETSAYSQLFVGGNWDNNGSFNPSTGKVTFNSGVGTKSIDGGSSAFYDIDINAGATYDLSGTLSLKRTLTLNGALSLNGQTLNLGDGSGTDYLNVNGILDVNANSNLQMGATSYLQVNAGGIMQLLGTDSDNPANITHQSAGNYSFDVNSGGTLVARFYTADYLNANGLWMHGGAILDPVNNLSDGSFSQGTAGGTYLKFENEFGGNITLSDVVFNNGPQYNVTRTSGTDQITMRDAAGTIGAFLYERDQTGLPDPNTGLILWTYVNSYIWTGAVDTNWHNPGNWMTNLVPDITKSAIIPDVVNDPIISNAAAVSKRVTLYTAASLGINNQNLTAADNIVNDGTITATGTPIISVAGNWGGITGTFNSGSSKVIFNAAGGNKTIAIGTGNFYDFEISSAAAATYQFEAATSIRNNLNILSGKLDGSNFDLTVGGDWISTGTFIPGLRTVTLNATSGSHALNNGANTFYNLIVYSGNGTGTSTFLLNSPLTVTKNYTLRKGTFDLSPNGGTTSNNLTVGNRLIVNGGNLIGRAATINVAENWQVSNPGVFTCGTSSVNMTSPTGTKSITPGFSPFYNLNVNTGGTYRISNNSIINNNLVIVNGTLDVSLSPSYNITVGGNWTNNGTFIARNGTTTFNGTTQTLTKVGSENFYNLVFTNNTQLTLASGNILATNALTFTSGRVTTGIYKLSVGTSIGNPGTFNYTTGRVIGQLERWVTASGIDYLFPIGNITDNENLTLNFDSGLTPGSILAGFISADPGASGLPVSETGVDIVSQYTEGYWNVTALNGMASSSYNITLTVNGFTSHFLNNDTRILKRTNGGNWVLNGTHASPSNPNFFRNGINGLSTSGTQFCLGDIDCLGGTIGTNQSVCLGDPPSAFTNTLLPRGGSGAYIYTWQYSTSATAVPGDSNWTDIPASNSPDYTPGAAIVNTYFVRKVSGTGCGTNKFSNKVSMIILPKPTTRDLYRIPNN